MYIVWSHWIYIYIYLLCFILYIKACMKTMSFISALWHNLKYCMLLENTKSLSLLRRVINIWEVSSFSWEALYQAFEDTQMKWKLLTVVVPGEGLGSGGWGNFMLPYIILLYCLNFYHVQESSKCLLINPTPLIFFLKQEHRKNASCSGNHFTTVEGKT